MNHKSRFLLNILSTILLLLAVAGCSAASDSSLVPTLDKTALLPTESGGMPVVPPTGTLFVTVPPAAVSGSSGSSGATGVDANATAVPLATFTPTIATAGNTAPTAAGNGSTGVAAGAACNNAPTGWVAYTIQAGDALGVLAQRGNVTVEQIVAANCLPNPDMIPAGQVIYVPLAAAGNAASGNANTANTANTGGTTGTTGQAAPSSGPAIQNIWVEPAIVVDSQYVVGSGAAITLKAGAVTNAAKVTFMMSPVGSNVAPTIIGVDTNLADGVSVKWTAPANLRANIWAVATNSANESTQTQPIVVYTK